MSKIDISACPMIHTYTKSKNEHSCSSQRYFLITIHYEINLRLLFKNSNTKKISFTIFTVHTIY